MSEFYVYALYQADNTPFYVGYGRGARWLTHERDARADRGWNRAKRAIIQEHIAAGTPVKRLKIAENLSREAAVRLEIELIRAVGRRPTGPLVNGTDGGDGSPGLAAETRARISAAKRGRPVPPEVRAKISATVRAYNQRPEVKRANAEAHRGRRHTPEARAKMSAWRKGRKFSAEHNAKISAALKGRKHSAAHRAAHSAAIKGRSLRPEHRAKIAASLIGNTRTRTPLTPEAIAAIREAYVGGTRQADLARQHCVGKNVIWRVIHTWKDGPLPFGTLVKLEAGGF